MNFRFVCFLLLIVVVIGRSPAAVAAEPAPDRLVVLTFDDAVKSHFSVVRPILLEHGFGATFFVTEGFDFRDNKRDYMTWDEIAQLDPVHHGVAQRRPYLALDEDGPVVATATSDAIFLGIGTEVVQLHEPALERVARWTLDAPVESVHAGTNGVLYIAVGDRLLAVRLNQLGSIDDPLLDVEVDGIRGIADALPVTSKGSVDCAC